MAFVTGHTLHRSRLLVGFTLVAFVTSIVIVPCSAMNQVPVESDVAIPDRFDQVINLRGDGRYADAIELLIEIIKEYTESEKVLREAYNQLLFTYLVKDDPGGAEGSAREALTRFPDIRADEVLFRPEVNETYDRLRKEMFGSLTITKPDGGRVFLDGEHRGDTPVDLPYVPVGEYELTVTKSGYRDYVERISIKPGTPESMALSLDRKRGKWWWITGAALIAGTVGVLALVLGGDDGSGEPAPEPLPGPPSTP